MSQTNDARAIVDEMIAEACREYDALEIQKRFDKIYSKLREMGELAPSVEGLRQIAMITANPDQYLEDRNAATIAREAAQ